MRVLVVAEYYPRAADPVLGVWAHRQALAAREAGAEVRVLVLHRPLPPISSLRSRHIQAIAAPIRQARSAHLDGIRIDYVRYLSPPRPSSYASWGAWAAGPLARTLNRVRRAFPFDVIHAHYAVPAGDAARRAAPGVPLVVSVHGGDVYGTHAGSSAVRDTLADAWLVLANSAGTARRCRDHGARRVRVVHLGSDVPSEPLPRPRTPTLVTVGHLIARKRHADVISALPLLRERHPDLGYVIIGDGPERDRLGVLASSLGVEGQVQFRGQLPHPEAVSAARGCSIFVLPSVDEAFGVAYVEAMAGGIPAIGCVGQDGPQEIAAAGGGIALVDASDARALADRIHALLSEPGALTAMGRAARSTVERCFTWQQCGRKTVQAYRDVLGLHADRDGFGGL